MVEIAFVIATLFLLILALLNWKTALFAIGIVGVLLSFMRIQETIVLVAIFACLMTVLKVHWALIILLLYTSFTSLFQWRLIPLIAGAIAILFAIILFIGLNQSRTTKKALTDTVTVLLAFGLRLFSNFVYRIELIGYLSPPSTAYLTKFSLCILAERSLKIGGKSL